MKRAALGLLGLVALGCSGGEDDPPAQGDHFPDAVPGDLPAAPAAAVASCTDRFREDASCPVSTGRVFYVSSSEGSDQNDGLSSAAPLQTVAAINALELDPGDRVLFRCGDVWRGEELVISRSGAECSHIVYSSYPEEAPCEVPPTLLGSQPVTGFAEDAPNVWVADLDEGENAGRFPVGITQVFAGDARLPIGRWPNLDDVAFPGGWAHMDAGGSSIQDADLPDTDWTGAIARAKTIRWLLLSRRVTGSQTGLLGLNDPLDCWDGCGDPDGSGPEYGWGYHLVSHRATLDQAGEWYHDDTENRLYVVSASEPTDIEASSLPEGVDPAEPRFRAGVALGADMGDSIAWVVVENLRVKNHFLMGIASPVNFRASDSHDLVVRCNTVTHAESIGISLSTWVYDCTSCTDDWYGGSSVVVSGNVIEGPNRHGIFTRADDAVFEGNLIRGVGQLASLGEAGLGCGFEGSNCTEHGGAVLVMGTSNAVFRRNTIDGAGHTGFDVFGDHVVIEENVIDRACSTKGDCGAICSFGGDSLADTSTHDLTLRRNVIRDVVGPTDGDASAFSELFGFGLYVDHNSRDVLAEGNVVTRTSVAGILYQNSTGSIVDNVVFEVTGRGREVVSLSGTTMVASFTGNTLVALDPEVMTIRGTREALGASDQNVFYNPYSEAVIALPDAMTLAEWQAASGLDGASVAASSLLAEGEAPNLTLLLNDTAVDRTETLTGSFVDLTGAAVTGSVTIPGFGAVVLVD